MGRRTFLLFFLLLAATMSYCFAINVTYDGRALMIDGKRRVLVSGSIHYPRSTPEMWPDLIKKSKEGGLDIIETYVFWDMHEPGRGQFDFTGRKDLVKFIKLVGEAGLYVFLRIGPYVCAEWNYGGFPLWLHYLPGIELRIDNEPYKAEMKRFTAKIVDMMKQEKLYASQGGPIILSQIENEYGNIDWEYGDKGKSYLNWAAQMAASMNTESPWINTCNGFYCDQFTPNSNQKPKIFTELWSGWFSGWGDPVPYRPTEDVAFSVARFYQRNGTLVNYYMYHGGTNFGRTSGGPFITTSYDYDAPIDEYGLLRQPKWGHLRDLHKAIKLCEEAMVTNVGNTTSPDSNLEVTIYETGSGLCAAFLANLDPQSDKTVNFRGNSYDLPAWSVSILPDCKNVVYNTAKVNSLTTMPKFVSEPFKNGNKTSTASQSSWSWFQEPVGISSKNAFVLPGLVEQINTTGDRSDYLWYSLSTHLEPNDPLLRDGSSILLHVDSLGHALYAFANGKLAGSGKGSVSNQKVSIEIPVALEPGNNTIDLLSMTVGLSNYGAFFDKKGAGITGPVELKGSSNGSSIDLSSQQWTYQIGLEGEQSNLYKGSSTLWVSKPSLPKNTTLTWYKTTFSAPPGTSPVAIDFQGMGKGHAWVNGQGIGRYWPSNIASANGNCVASCNYRGNYSQSKCLTNCGKPTQQYNHVPRSWLKTSDNVLVLLEEMGGDPTKISFVTREIERLCSRVSESYPIPLDFWTSNHLTRKTKPTLSLECPSQKQVITGIQFVSFGNPHGTCGSFNHGRCRSKEARRIVHKACVGKRRCDIEVTVENLGNPCANVTKSLVVEASCS
ncbi:hypothetical protein BUALT_Bualt02G0048300 [Buddleja alternifolia]|uniref:Beta-galactosidase n=1 Tax=Buddleja alternifolia TaxID=168488 RepID=A0AAV6Y861_9LAMI|nr:hypothetical protein BUALT_Bualt02G0048300 [Buddleja alternifolia]